MTRDLNEVYRREGILTESFVPSPQRGISEALRKKYKKIPYEELLDGTVRIHRFPMFREGKAPLLRAFRYLLVNVIQYVKGSRVKDADLLMSTSTPPTQGLLFGLLKRRLARKYGHPVPFLYNLQDIFPDSMVHTGLTRKGSLVYRIGRRIEDFTYRNADAIIVISEDFKRNIMAKGVPEEKIHVIPNWANTDEIRPVSRENNVLFDRYGLDRSLFYLCYSGTLGYTQNLDLLLDAAKDLSREMPDLRVVLIGDGPARANVEERIRKEKLFSVILLPFQPYEEISHVFSLGDAGLVISKPGISENSVPSKTWGIMAAARPVIASFDRDSTLTRLLQSTGAGLVSDAQDLEGLKQAVRDLRSAGGHEMGERGRHYIAYEMNRERCTAMYVDLIRKTARPH